MQLYLPRTRNYSKSDLVMRWNLPDRVFFACGACQVLAYAFINRFNLPGAKAVWIKPDEGHTGNHIFVAFADKVFDYHGYSKREDFLEHYWKRSIQRYSEWGATLIALPSDVLISNEKSRTYDGLWLREPNQFLENALPRAERFLDRFPKPY